MCVVFAGVDLIRKESNKESSEIQWKAQLYNGTYHLPQLPSPLHLSQVNSSVHSITYIWCTGSPDQFFNFRHFLSIRSALLYLNPQVIHVYCDRCENIDGVMYNTWFYELQSEFPHFVIHHHLLEDMCDRRVMPRISFILNRLRDNGGIYLNWDVIWFGAPSVQITTTSIFSEAKIFHLAYVSMSSKPEERDRLCMADFILVNQLFCSSDLCMGIINRNIVSPRDLWSSNSILERTLLYGEVELPKAQPHDHEVIPRIAHYVWFGGGTMQYLFFLSVLSCIYILKLEAVYIHGDIIFTGRNWERLQNETRLHWIYRTRPSHIFGYDIEFIAHEADVASADIMVQYGGIHADPDLIFIRPLDSSMWRFDAIAAPARNMDPPFPAVINWGVFLGRPNAPFWWLVQKAQRNFLAEEWNWNSARVLYKIYERNPQLLYLTPDLQVTCNAHDCYPKWLNKTCQFDDSPITEWILHVYSLHFPAVAPLPLMYAVEACKNPAFFRELGFYILRSAGRRCVACVCM